MKGPSIPERIVWFVRDRGITEAHRSAVEDLLRINRDQWEQSIARARDLAIEDGLALTPIYDRDGWWTVDPSRHTASRALQESAHRNLGEAARNARVLADLEGVSHTALLTEASHIGIRALIESQLDRDLAVNLDYVVERVDRAIAAGKLIVERERPMRMAA